jgi:hypothetical protein
LALSNSIALVPPERMRGNSVIMPIVSSPCRHRADIRMQAATVGRDECIPSPRPCPRFLPRLALPSIPSALTRGEASPRDDDDARTASNHIDPIAVIVLGRSLVDLSPSEPNDRKTERQRWAGERPGRMQEVGPVHGRRGANAGVLVGSPLPPPPSPIGSPFPQNPLFAARLGVPCGGGGSHGGGRFGSHWWVGVLGWFVGLVVGWWLGGL